MKRLKSEQLGVRRLRLSHLLLGMASLYLLYICYKFPGFFKSVGMLSGDDSYNRLGSSDFVNVNNGDILTKPLLRSVSKDTIHRRLDNENDFVPLIVPGKVVEDNSNGVPPMKPFKSHYGRITGDTLRQMNRTNDLSVLENMADEAWTLGLKAWEEVDNYNGKEFGESSILEGRKETCPSWVSTSEEELANGDQVMFLPCGLAAGSSITVVGTPKYAHNEYIPRQANVRTADSFILVSQFMVELQGLKSVVGEDPPKILHLNPRLRGDWSHLPVIEHNTCYRMQWGTGQRCDGLPSKSDDDMLVDGYLRCEKWMRNDNRDKESRTTSWFQRFIGRAKKPEVTWPFPFVEGKMFVLTLRAGLDGFHVITGGRHVTSFPYRTGLTLEEATGLAIKGDVDIHSVFATSLPTSHPSFSPQRVLDMSEKWKSQPLLNGPTQLFIGVLSATNHFAERMAVRKTWMQASAIKSSIVVVRFFVALNPRKEVNAVLKQEAAYFGDIVILPFMDRYELVVLKTIAICEFGVQNATAAYIMKCDDDTFIRVDTVMKELDKVSGKRPLYMGNLNLLHRPLRSGKWAVSYEEYPQEVYPPYANGPGYIISKEIAKYIISKHVDGDLKDVSMGMWVEQFNSSTPVQYSHSWKFCQYGCLENYYTAHYQSPRQMICLWDKLVRGQARCCNF
ncbi:hydroxyproline O-galactosyltransferase GALT2-like isoform X2 [Daucus carota subsp. sativus]|uniref:hydroxyproline O-galactosyltransferase GALT2-like isoform X2 n=1 Tax=Daucus carota subsp. sativus TaxID=79200 RepID=UPI0007F02915|nr:PREDICTED: hydroxyproline O-galactosyltransferase GALT2-like isoform X2 [Daucus carota subsp. sativus]